MYTSQVRKPRRGRKGDKESEEERQKQISHQVFIVFIGVASNKTEMFHILAEMSEAETAIFIVIKGEHVISNTRESLDSMSLCCHEEADTPIFENARDATTDG